MSVGHLDHVLLILYNSTKHVTWKSPDPCTAELVESCVRGLPDPKCLFYLSSLLLCLPSVHFCLVPVMTWFSTTAWSVTAEQTRLTKDALRWASNNAGGVSTYRDSRRISGRLLLDRKVTSTFGRSNGTCSLCVSTVTRYKQMPPCHASVNRVYD